MKQQSSEYVEAQIAAWKKKGKRTRILSYIILALLCTVVFSFSTFSRYTATVESYDEANVAIIALTEDVYTDGNATTTEYIDLDEMKPGETQEIFLKIRSAEDNIQTTPSKVSTVSQVFDVAVTADLNNLPLTYKIEGIRINDNGYNSYGTCSTTAALSSATVQDAKIKYGDNFIIYKITVAWPDTTDANKSYTYSGETERIKIVVTSEQDV